MGEEPGEAPQKTQITDLGTPFLVSVGDDMIANLRQVNQA